MTRANVVPDELKWTPCCYGHDVMFDMTKLFMTSKSKGDYTI